MKKVKKELSVEDIKMQKLLEELREVQKEMNIAYTNLENVVDNELIDCLIYELNATQIRYKVILNQVKQLQPV
ncbi:MAG: YaaL family protein [Lachnospiraceae bacterium]|nr:YaaL family protein [Lachnospiraceae bacterium]